MLLQKTMFRKEDTLLGQAMCNYFYSSVFHYANRHEPGARRGDNSKEACDC
jgi:hypothetical protein